MAARSKKTPAKISTAKIKKILHETFGLEDLRPLQKEVIESVLAKRPTLAIMPTGAGKSLCYQIPSVLLPGTTVVVSPLIALMKDQKEKMDELHIAATELNSAIPEKEQRANLEQVVKGKTEIVYTTPERISSPEFLASLKKTKIDLLVIDEAHCLTQWGHDFRPSYLAIRDAWKTLGEPTLLALTATATTEVIEDIKKQMGIPKLEIFHSGVLRENLKYEAIHAGTEAEKVSKLMEIIPELNGSGIIYSATIKGVETIYDALTAAGIRATRYHGKLSAKTRNENQNSFMSGQVPIVVATNAFGMGIDKSDIRFVVHFHFPGSLESYYQESGRAGRDGENSRCILLYLKQDKRTQNFFLAGKYPTTDEIKTVYQYLQVGKNLDDVEAVAKNKKRVIVSALSEMKIAKRGSKDKKIKLIETALQEAEIVNIAQSYVRKKENDLEKLKHMIMYAQSALCRWKTLLKYFEQQVDWELCGHCDNCQAGHNAQKYFQGAIAETAPAV